MRTGTPAWRAVGTAEGPFTGSAFVPRAVAVEDAAIYLRVSGLHMLLLCMAFPKHATTGDVCTGPLEHSDLFQKLRKRVTTVTAF